MKRSVYLFLAFSLIALSFLGYTLLNLKKLHITILHPRVLVEFGLFVIFFLIAIYLHLK